MSTVITFLTSLPTWLLSFFGNHFELVIGYIICVLFPVPWLNSWIISLWAKLLASKATSTVATDISTVVSSAETAVSSTITPPPAS